MDRALLTCAEPSEGLMAAELRGLFPDLGLLWLGSGVALTAEDVYFDSFTEEVTRAGLLFVRHLAPAQQEVSLRGDPFDVQTLTEAAAMLAPRVHPSRPFAVQVRLLAEGLPYRRADISAAVAARIAALTGAREEVRAPGRVVSILGTREIGYLGVSRVEQNRSAWPGGERRYRREEAQISRAEFKLLEALEAFNLRLPERGAALDLGASPGGWTRVLRERGLQVVAVDPGELDARLARDPGVRVIRRRIQDYLPCRQAFDVLVNDMRMDARESVEMMLSARDCLKPGGPAVMTLKLPESGVTTRDALALAREALARLSEGYAVLGARQLFHNRSEITAALRREAGS